ncbi:Donson [Phytophthora cactorum]|nr:Donson [Phytophthora cactorum]
MDAEGGAVQEPNKEPATNGTPSPGKLNVSKAKRLLPMELRKRRRAAKLQVSAEKKARVTSGATFSTQAPSASARSPGKTEITGEVIEDTKPSRAFHEAKSAEVSPAKAAKKASPSKSTPQKSPRAKAPTSTTSTRLHSLYNSSLLSQKTQNRRLVPGANVSDQMWIYSSWVKRVAHIWKSGCRVATGHCAQTKLSILIAFPYPFQRSTYVTYDLEALGMIWFVLMRNFMTGGSIAQQQLLKAQRCDGSRHCIISYTLQTQYRLQFCSTERLQQAQVNHCWEVPQANTNEKKKLFSQHVEHWQESFRDVYMNFRRQASSTIGDTQDRSFYLRSSEFVVYFLYDTDGQDATGNGPSIINLCRQHAEQTKSSENPTEEANNRHLRAVMSQSSARTRKVLHHLNVEYTMPYIKANQTQREVGEFHLLEEELEATRKRSKDRNGGTIMTRTTAAPENMHGATHCCSSTATTLHGLYEFLINRAPMSNQDVPVLYALYPFANASIKSLQVTSFGHVGAAATESVSEDQPSRSATLFRIEILGFCFPSSIARLLAVLKDEWEATHSSYDLLEPSTGGKNAQIVLRTYMEALAGAERLNAIKLDEEVAKESGEKRSEQQERQKRRQELEFSKRRMEIAAVTKMESRYNVETTSRTIVVRR